MRHPTRERRRLVVEALGGALIITALGMISITLAALLTGVALVAIANLYMEGDDDADRGDGNPPNPD